MCVCVCVCMLGCVHTCINMYVHMSVCLISVQQFLSYPLGTSASVIQRVNLSTVLVLFSLVVLFLRFW